MNRKEKTTLSSDPVAFKIPVDIIWGFFKTQKKQPLGYSILIKNSFWIQRI